MRETRPAGPILDELGVTFELEDDDRITEILILAKMTNMETGRTVLLISSNDLDWIATAGLHAAAAQVLMADPPTAPPED